MRQLSARARFLLLIALITVSCAAPPNFIVILLDDVGWGDFSIQGSPSIQTPNIDRLAQQGIRFQQCYTAQPICTPSRAAMLTGRLPVRLGMYQTVSVNGTVTASQDEPGACVPDLGMSSVLWWNSINGMPASELMLPTMLKAKNYTSSLVGKWHVGIGKNYEYLPLQRGFDDFYGLPLWHMSDQGDESQAPDVPLMDGNTILGRLFKDIPLGNLVPMYTTRIASYLEERAKDERPFFLYYAPDNTHSPVASSPAFTGKSIRGPYGDALEEIDWSIGQIMAQLRQFGLDENTFVFISSDNGPALYMENHAPMGGKLEAGSAGPLKGGKGTTWEGGVRVPCIAHFPGFIEPAQVSYDLISLMDVFPTLAELAGVSPPNDRTYDGVSMVPLLNQTGNGTHEFIFHWRGGDLFAVSHGQQYKAHFYTQGDIMYTTPPTQKHDPPLLFQIQRDPRELFPITSNKDDTNYEKEIAAITVAAKKHLANMVKGKPLFNDCDPAVGMWLPELPVPPSAPNCCVGGGN